MTSGFITLTANAIHSPGDAFVVGIVLQQTGSTPDVGAQLRRNTILSHRVGFAANNTEFPVYLNGDLITKSANIGLSMGDSDDDGDGEVPATNITIADSLSTDASVSSAELTLSSSLLASSGPGIIASGVAPTCADHLLPRAGDDCLAATAAPTSRPPRRRASSTRIRTTTWLRARR